MIHETKSILLIDNRYFEAAKKKVKNCEVRLFKNYNDLSDIFKELNIKTLVVEEEYTTLELLNKLQELGCKTVGVLSRK
ncbi:aminopeptidase P family N-terminal domain-containing protein [bacterium]|nr:aminopeptidase P family N-terminal domain-containing protein [bacterium]MBO6072807.1 aminopeptidase P family N-terminal domain-containing protein [bacterium]MBO7044094.1 aminopeptidase P family N-terminal domain-containing protein [bacterium]